jgi:hypothetical protein
MLARSLTLLALAMVMAPAQAIAAPGDVAATHAYIQANYALARASVARIGPAQVKIESLNGSLARECPGVGAGSLEDEASQPVSHEVAVALWSLAWGTDAGPVRAFVNVVRRLHWSNRTITRIAARYARSMRELSTVPLPHLCQDVGSWKASGFQVIPPSVLQMVRQVEAIEPKTVPPGLLAPYERGEDAGVLARTLRLETRLAENEFMVGQSDWIQVLQTLGLNL